MAALEPGLASSKRWWLAVALCLIVLAGIALRVYRLDELLIFLGDQGRDVTAVWQMVESGEPVLLGPGSAFGQFKRGPAYYYFLLSGLTAGGGNPLGAELTLIALDAAAIVLLYVAGRSIAGPYAGLTAAALYATAGAATSLVRSFGNPGVLPFLSILTFVALLRLIKGDTRFLPVLVGALVLAWQMHDQAVLLILWAVGVLLLYRPRVTWRSVGISAVGALVLLSPFLWYEAQNQFVNLRTMRDYILHSASQNAQGNVGGAALARLLAVGNLTQAFLPLTGFAHWLLVGAAIASWLALLWQLRTQRNRALQLLALYSILPVLYVIWPGPVYSSMLEIVLPMPFLLVGYGVGRVMQLERRAGLAAAAVVLLVCVLSGAQVVSELGRRTADLQALSVLRRVVETVIAESGGKPFLMRLDTSKIGEAFDSPYTYLFHWLGAKNATTADADTFLIFDPADRAPDNLRVGQVLDNIRIVRLLPPSPAGSPVMQGLIQVDDLANWTLRGGEADAFTWDAAAGALELDGTRGKRQLVAVHRLALAPNTDYSITFEHRMDTAPGSLDAAVWCLDANAGVGDKFDWDRVGAPADQTQWQRGMFLVHTPAGCSAASLRLSYEGDGKGWFRGASVQPVELKIAP